MQLIAKQKDLNDDEKMAHGMDAIAAIWDATNKTKAYLQGKLTAGETQAEADIFMEDVIGRAWQMAELKEKGYGVSDLSLLELAFERIDNEARQQRFEVSNLLNLESGAIHQAVVIRPFKGLSQVPEQPSYQTLITVAEGAVCPGFINRRLRWEKGTEQLIENPPSDLLAMAHALANADFNSALEEFRNQLQHPLAPREAVFFLQPARVGRLGDRIVLVDADGTRIEMKDRRKDYSNVVNLVRAAGMMHKDKPAILVRLYWLPFSNTVFGLPLAAVSAKGHLRLGV